MKRKKKISVGGRALILLHDGSQWYGGIRRSNGRWDVRREKASDSELPPDPLLEWAVNQGALNVRIAVSADLYQFETDTADMLVLSPSEVYQMLSYELAEKSGGEADNIAPAVVRCADLGLDSNPDQLIGGAIERSMIAGLLDLFRQYGMKLEGISSMQALLLCYHAAGRDEVRESMLFFGEKLSFICGLPHGERHTVYRSIPVGYPKLNRSEEYDRRIERRIKSYAGNAMNIVAIEDALAASLECVTPVIGDNIRTTAFKDLVPELMQHLAGARRYMLEGPVALTNLPPKVKDDKYTGGVICFWAIFLTTSALAFMFCLKTIQKRSLTDLKTAVKNIEQKQSSAQSTFSRAEQEIADLKKMHGFLSSEPQKVDRHYTEILVALSKTLPRYSRVNEVYQTKDRTVFSGSTLWPQELSDFSIALQNELNALGLRVLPKTATPDDKSNSTLFTMEIL